MFLFKRFILLINVMMIASSSQTSDESEKIIIDQQTDEISEEKGI